MDLDRPHFRTTSIGSSSGAAAPTSTTSELFICFTSRLSSSSSMKLARSILSPGRAARDGGGGASLSSSLGRRLRSNGSIKGGQASPFFTTTGKKRGCGFDNPEPSSPKVTCIGQVRVKSKKKVKQQTRSLSRRRSGGGGGNGEVSFRKIEQADGEDRVRYSNASAHYQQQGQQQMQGEGMHHRKNQRWVHLPVSICEALREFSCLFPCKGSCFSTSERDKGGKQGQGCGGSSRGGESGCGAVFARWLVSVNDGEGGERREIELMVGGADDEVELEEKAVVERMSSMRSSRRHVFEDIEVKDDNRIEVKGQSVEGEEEAARVSICIPPKNALLLMRCRSDPMKMADLAHRFSWDANAAAAAASKNKEYEDIEEEIKGGEVDEDFEAQIRRCEGNYEVLERGVAAAVPSSVGQEIADGAEADLEMKVGRVVHGEEICKEELVGSNEEMVVEEEENREELEQEIEVNGDEVLTVAEVEEEEEEKVESNMSSFEALLDQESAEHYEDCPTHEMDEVVADSPISDLSSSSSSSSVSDEEEDNSGSSEVTSPLRGEEVAAATGEKLEKQASDCAAEKDTIFGNNDEENKLETRPETTHRVDEGKREEEAEHTTMPLAGLTKNHEKEDLAISSQETKKEKESPVLPDCLLLMMCEPKLSMEVSKETWVCSTDFMRWLPERPPRKAAKSNKPGGGCPHEPVKKRLSTDSKPTKPIPDAPPAPQVNNDHQLHLQQPPRSSCSLPMAAKASSMATMIEQKLVNAVAIEPFVLTRCKSEPMRTSAAKLMPESCFWKNAVRKLEPHRRATVGVGAAGVGF